MFDRHVSAAIFSLALAVGLQAQNGIVSPAHFGSAEGPTWFSYGLATWTPTHRLLQIHEDLQGTARTIRAIAFRRDGTTGATSAHAGGTMLVNVFVSTAATTAAAPDATFDANHGNDRVQVGRNVVVQIPPTPPGMGPRDFELRVPFQQPFQYAGTGPLCIELQITSNTSPSGLYVDGVQGQSTSPQAVTWTFGSGCIAATTQTRAMSLNVSTSTNWTTTARSRLNFTGASFPPNALVFLTFGFQSRSLGALPLPFEIPGSAGAASGACTIYNDILVDVPQLSDPNGRMTTQVDLPVSPSSHGVDVFTQTLALDAGANAFGIVASNSTRVHYVAPYGQTPIGMVYVSNGLGPTGTVRANAGLITRFE